MHPVQTFAQVKNCFASNLADAAKSDPSLSKPLIQLGLLNNARYQRLQVF
jgi:hypothetical protein